MTSVISLQSKPSYFCLEKLCGVQLNDLLSEGGGNNSSTACVCVCVCVCVCAHVQF